MQKVKNLIVSGYADHPMATDIFLPDMQTKSPVIVYTHGFNGFKDWGNFDLVAGKFATAGYAFVKFNFSHNGTTPDHLQDFVDLEAFGQNNYTIQLADLQNVIDWVSAPDNIYAKYFDIDKIYLIGHSMGGGISILAASEDSRIKKLVTWASISECKTPWGSWDEDRLAAWKLNGVDYTLNSRTKQRMPLYYQLHEDFLQHEERLNIGKAIQKLHIPILLCHGSKDTSVAVEKAYELHNIQPSAELFIQETDHVFGRSHPWPHDYLPRPMDIIVTKTIEWMK